MNYLLASKRRIHSCDPFTADEATVYYVPSECFDAYIDRAQNKVLNRLVSVAVTDENGMPVRMAKSCSAAMVRVLPSRAWV